MNGVKAMFVGLPLVLCAVAASVFVPWLVGKVIVREAEDNFFEWIIGAAALLVLLALVFFSWAVGSMILERMVR